MASAVRLYPFDFGLDSIPSFDGFHSHFQRDSIQCKRCIDSIPSFDGFHSRFQRDSIHGVAVIYYLKINLPKEKNR